MPENTAMDGKKPRWALAFTGNCQSLYLASVFNSLPDVEAAYFGLEGRFLPFKGRSAMSYAEAQLFEKIRSWQADGCQVIFCEQLWPIAPVRIMQEVDGLLYGSARFPNLESFALWPEKKYTAKQLERLSSARLLRLDLASGGANKNGGIDMSDIYGERYRTEIVFDTPRHPSALVMATMVERLTAESPLGDIPGSAALVSEVAAARGINTRFKHPIAPEIVDDLDLAWARTASYMTWRSVVDTTGRHRNPEVKQLIEEMLEKKDDPFFVRMIEPFALARLVTIARQSRDWPTAEARIRDVIAADAYNPYWYIWFGRIAIKDGRLPMAREIVDGGMALIPDNKELLSLLAEVEQAEGETGGVGGKRTPA